jgi:hypothetical protein
MAAAKAAIAPAHLARTIFTRGTLGRQLRKANAPPFQRAYAKNRRNAAQAARGKDARGVVAADLFALALFSICSSISFKNIPGIKMGYSSREGC